MILRRSSKGKDDIGAVRRVPSRVIVVLVRSPIACRESSGSGSWFQYV